MSVGKDISFGKEPYQSDVGRFVTILFLLNSAHSGCAVNIRAFYEG